MWCVCSCVWSVCVYVCGVYVWVFLWMECTYLCVYMFACLHVCEPTLPSFGSADKAATTVPSNEFLHFIPVICPKFPIISVMYPKVPLIPDGWNSAGQTSPPNFTVFQQKKKLDFIILKSICWIFNSFFSAFSSRYLNKHFYISYIIYIIL